MVMRVWAIDVGVDGEEATSNELMPMNRERQAERADQEGRRREVEARRAEPRSGLVYDSRPHRGALESF